jgi:hypothetical protein
MTTTSEASGAGTVTVGSQLTCRSLTQAVGECVGFSFDLSVGQWV